MKRRQLLLLVTMFVTTVSWADVAINETNFPDKNFRNFLLSQSYGSDGVLTDAEIANVSSLVVEYRDIQSLKGIEFFTSLTGLYCNNNQLTALDLSKNTALKYLYVYQNQLSGTAMDAFLANLPQVDDSMMRIIYHENEQNTMTAAQVDAAKAKGWTPYASNGQKDQWGRYEWYEYTAGGIVVEGIAVDETNFPDEKFRNYILLQSWGSDAVLTETELSSVSNMNVSGLGIADLQGIEYFTSLTNLDCSDNQLMALDVSKNRMLRRLFIYKNQINGISGFEMDKLVASLPKGPTSWGRLYVICGEDDQNVMSSKQASYARSNCGWTPYYSTGEIGVSGSPIFENIYTGSEPVFDDGVSITEVNFPDANFRKYLLLQWFGTDEFLSTKEIRAVNALDCSSKDIMTLQGLEFFKGLTSFDCHNNQIGDIDVTSMTALNRLDCHNNAIIWLDLSNNVHLEYLNYSGNPRITAYCIAKCVNLKYLDCEGTGTAGLDLSYYPWLEHLNCANNGIYSLDLSHNPRLKYLSCWFNYIGKTGMEELVNSLPNVTNTWSGSRKMSLQSVTRGTLNVIYGTTDKNEITAAQIATANNKGWSSYYSTGQKDESGEDIWIEYEFSEPALRGDVNGDGKVDMDDATFVTNIILGTEDATKEADVNNDGTVSMPDAMFIVNKILNGKFPDEK